MELRLKRNMPLSMHSYLTIPFLKFLFYDKKKYHQYYVKYLDYFNQILAGYGEFNYFNDVINQKILLEILSLRLKNIFPQLLKNTNNKFLIKKNFFIFFYFTVRVCWKFFK